MLTLESILRATKQQTGFGEGRHRFGHGTERIVPVTRDKQALPKTEKESE